MPIPHPIHTLPVLALFLTGCGQKWQMDYGRPAAQFRQEDLAAKGAAFVGRKITVRGTVTKVDVSVPGSARIYLADGIECDLVPSMASAKSCAVGETLYVDGFLKQCGPGKVVIAPAMLREATAPFSPE